MSVRFMSLASGSSGNCYFLGTDTYGILIDAGIGVRTIIKRLKNENIPIESIRAVFVTHDHSDHIKSIGVLGENLYIPVYTTRRIHEGINRSYCVTEKLHSCVRYLEKNEPLSFFDFTIESFAVPHDGTDNVGYFIRIEGKTFCFVTDLGEITDSVGEYLDRANYLIIEANYDEQMLMTGNYPPYLKQRIQSDHGHLCNADTAAYLAEHWTEKLKYIWLCHLSKDNNHPELAYKTVEGALAAKGVKVGEDVRLFALKRSAASELFFFD